MLVSMWVVVYLEVERCMVWCLCMEKSFSVFLSESDAMGGSWKTL